MLRQIIQDKLLASLKEKNTQTVTTLRFLQSTIKNKEIEKKTELTDEEIIQIIRKQVKELTDANVLFEKGGRADLVAENDVQIKILQQYLPAEISDEELKNEIDLLIEKNHDAYQKNPKVIIGICMGALKSKASPERIMKMLNNR